MEPLPDHYRDSILVVYQMFPKGCQLFQERTYCL